MIQIRIKAIAIGVLLFMFSGAGNSRAQKMPDDRLIDRELHVGVGFHQAIHVGGRFRVDPFVMLEANYGIYPFGTSPIHTFSFGLSAIPRAAQRNPGLIYSVLYTLWYKDDLIRYTYSNTWTGFIHFVTGNIGWIIQHASGISFLARLGGGIAISDYDFFYGGTGDGIGHEVHVEFWPNVDVTLGYAF